MSDPTVGTYLLNSGDRILLDDGTGAAVHINPEKTEVVMIPDTRGGGMTGVADSYGDALTAAEHAVAVTTDPKYRAKLTADAVAKTPGAVVAAGSAPAVKIEHREQVVRQVPFGLSVFSYSSHSTRTGRKDSMTAVPAGRPGHAPRAKEGQKLQPVNTSRRHGVGRNASCPCGSGLKNKHCKCR